MSAKPKFQLLTEFDDETGEVLAAYLQVRDGDVSETVELAEGRANADYDSQGNLLGVELLAPCAFHVLDSLASQYHDEAIANFIRKSPPRSLVTN
ncbi:MAG: DUF2283 domain-containing protein [Gemmataceae bacterium]|nr:DUF2283 domain-containing protein [Gemmataceae bacterium]